MLILSPANGVMSEVLVHSLTVTSAAQPINIHNFQETACTWKSWSRGFKMCGSETNRWCQGGFMLGLNPMKGNKKWLDFQNKLQRPGKSLWCNYLQLNVFCVKRDVWTEQKISSKILWQWCVWSSIYSGLLRKNTFDLFECYTVLSA